MNLLDKRKSGLVIILALFLFACESDNIISLPFDPKAENINAHYTELTLPFKLVQIDSVNTTNRNRILIGNYQNDSLGAIKAVGFTDFSITNKGAVSSDDAFDSLSLIIVNDYYYGKAEAANLPQTFSIHRLDTLARKNHYSFDTYTYNQNALGSLTFMPDPNVASSTDTFRIRLDDALGQELFDKAKVNATELNSDSAFQDYFEGIALVPQNENNYITGFSLAGMQMVLYYSEPDETTSSTYTFALGSNSTITFTNIQYDRTGTAVANISEPGDEGLATDGKFYLQSGTGLSPMIDFTPLIDSINSIKNNHSQQDVLLNRVDLYVGLKPYTEGLYPPASIRGFEVDENFKRQAEYSPSARQDVLAGLFTNNSTRIPEASAIELDSLSYSQQITYYMQLLADGNTGVTETEFLFLADGFEYSLNQIITEPDSVKIKVYYTTLN